MRYWLAAVLVLEYFLAWKQLEGIVRVLVIFWRLWKQLGPHMHRRGSPSDPSSSTFEAWFWWEILREGNSKVLGFRSEFSFYALLPLISLGHLASASICGPGRFYKRQKITSSMVRADQNLNQEFSHFQIIIPSAKATQVTQKILYIIPLLFLYNIEDFLSFLDGWQVVNNCLK